MLTLYVFLIILFSTSATNKSTGIHMHPLSDEFILHINLKQNLWRAGRNFHRDVPLTYFKRLMGSLRNYPSEYLSQKNYDMDWERVPKEFDARLRWRGCPTLYDIRDQGSCGSCWAVAAVSAMTDRICIISNGTRNFYFSAEDVLSCCRNCGSGCNGGVLVRAWSYSRRKGVVSGGGFGSHQGCLPYEIEPCEHTNPGPRPECGSTQKTPICNKVCEPNYKVTYKRDKTRFQQIYTLNKTRAIKKEIFKNGPVTASFSVYSDFLNYKDGVYYHVAGKYIGGHSVKILGWGVEKGVKYWLVANSWNTDWGNNGFFKIKRGKNTCGIEEQIVFGD